MEHRHGQAFNVLVLQIQKLDPGEEQGSPQGHPANSNSGLLGSPPRNGDLAGSRGKLPASCVPSAGLPLEVAGSTSRFLQLPPAAPRPPQGTLCRQTEGTTTPSRPRDIMLVHTRRKCRLPALAGPREDLHSPAGTALSALVRRRRTTSPGGPCSNAGSTVRETIFPRSVRSTAVESMSFGVVGAGDGVIRD